MLTALLLLFDGLGKTRKLLHPARRRFDLDDAREVKAAGQESVPGGFHFVSACRGKQHQSATPECSVGNVTQALIVCPQGRFVLGQPPIDRGAGPPRLLSVTTRMITGQ
jgi:hypothetical protein